MTIYCTSHVSDMGLGELSQSLRLLGRSIGIIIVVYIARVAVPSSQDLVYIDIELSRELNERHL